MNHAPVVLGINRTQGSPVAEFTETWSGAAGVPGDRRELANLPCDYRWTDDYLGPRLQFEAIAAALADAYFDVPAITHVDGTARLQTAGPDDDPLLRALLTGFAERTGVPVLLNTSFNGKDERIVETPAQAVGSFQRMRLHALAMPPYLVTKRTPAALPELPA